MEGGESLRREIEIGWWGYNGKGPITVFWDMTPCSLIIIYSHFRGTYFLHLQGATLINSYYKARHHIPENSNRKDNVRYITDIFTSVCLVFQAVWWC
jgi:hypothetical protein